MTTIYFHPHTNRLKEKAFFDFLVRQLGDVQHIDKNYLLPIEMLKKQIAIVPVIHALQKNTKLSAIKKRQILQALSTLPAAVPVARKIAEVSVDFTIVNEETIRFIEFHESQHSVLTVSRQVPVFCDDGLRREIPRFAQRLLKDLWRWQHLDNYKIVWWDWFEKNNRTMPLADLFAAGAGEFYLPGAFNFSNFF